VLRRQHVYVAAGRLVGFAALAACDLRVSHPFRLQASVASRICHQEPPRLVDFNECRNELQVLCAECPRAAKVPSESSKSELVHSTTAMVSLDAKLSSLAELGYRLSRHWLASMNTEGEAKGFAG
jgi:hypothetical protein